ncbi:NAD(P)/FAD-dependent oxidoreductase [Ramlibacter albus]|uniref:FAD-dependent oxidoreductase n=1 Tax=Ramlibacter albus TaxID=2079448 RepID=A0A923M522_9BURK|nr:FAD-dependent oxidoreductase [Ramlibacter albus]MBC5763063.1 FAD-dependent oxidoreductase [Ramlibacter albus]
MQPAGVIVVGGGQGGFQVAASLRDEGYQGPVTVIGDEPCLPYQRPPLSKGFLTGKAQLAEIQLRPAQFYSDQRIDIMHDRVESIARSANRVRLASGRALAYEHLVLATGARPRMPSVPGAHVAGILPVRTVVDAQTLLPQLKQAKRLAVVGAGFIGLEVAVAAIEIGLEVEVLEYADRVLKRAVSAEAADYLARAEMQAGVRFRFNTAASGFVERDGRVAGVQTTVGETIAADLVVVGIGVQPNAELAQAADLAVHDGVMVNAYLSTSDPHISAIGDCARFPATYSKTPVRLESVQNAVDQARCVAARIAGRAEAYAKVPWFWSDQGANRLQIAGVAEAGDLAVVRGDVAAGKFSVFRFRDQRLTAVESINSAADHMASRKLLACAARISPEQAADTRIKLGALTIPC